VRQAWALPLWLDVLATERLPMNPSANPDTTPSTAEDTAESSLVGQDTPGSPDGTSVMPPAPGKNKAPPILRRGTTDRDTATRPHIKATTRHWKTGRARSRRFAS